MRYRETNLIRQTVLCLTFLAALAACLPINQPTPAAATLSAGTATPAVLPVPATIAAATPTPPQLPACLAQPGQLVDGGVDTTLLAKPMTYIIYLPPCYAEEQGQRYPVLYLLHGQTYNADQWIRLGVPATADRLIAAGQVPPFIIVFPYDYSYLQPWQYPFEDVFMHLLLPQIDRTYRTIPDKAHRAVGGLSRGGAWALHLGIHHPDVFGAIGAHSPAIFYSDVGSLPLYLRDIPADQLPRIYVDAGDADSELQTSQNFMQFLDRFNIPYEWHEYVGFHDEAYWGAHVEEYLLWYAQGWQSNP